MKYNKKLLAEYYQQNRKRIRKVQKEYYERIKESKKTLRQEIYKKNRKKILQARKRYYKIHREEILARVKRYHLKNYENFLEYNKQYYKQNKKKVIKRCGIRYKTDIEYHIKQVLSQRLRKALERNSKKTSTIYLLGCSIEFLKQHLEKQFKKRMAWDNYGKWHIDHIKPCASFDLTKLEEQKKCFHYTNLQPLWAKENLKKGARYEK